MGDTTSSNQVKEDIEKYSSLRRGDELINGRGIHGIYLGQQKGVVVVCDVFRKEFVYAHDLFTYDTNPNWSLQRIIYKGDDEVKREKYASAAEEKIKKAMSNSRNIQIFRLCSLLIGSRRNIRPRFVL